MNNINKVNYLNNDNVEKYDTSLTTNNDTGNLYGKINGYEVLQLENKYGNSYFLSIPVEHVNNYQMFVGFPKKDLKDLPKKEILEEVSEITKMLSAVNKNGIYLLPDIPLNDLEEAAKENDSKKFSSILNNQVQPMISEANIILKDYSTAERSINQVINFVKQTESDTKFVNWLEINLPNFIHGITYDGLKEYYNTMVSKEKTPVNQQGKEEIFDNTSRIYTSEGTLDDSSRVDNNEETLVKQNVKKRVLTRDYNGFLNIINVLAIISTLVLIGFLIKIFVIK